MFVFRLKAENEKLKKLNDKENKEKEEIKSNTSKLIKTNGEEIERLNKQLNEANNKIKMLQMKIDDFK